MVKLTKIYTRGGDCGETSLGDGNRVAKHSKRIEAIGAIDEANAAIGLARAACGGEAESILARIQNDLFDVGADVCTPSHEGDEEGKRLRLIDRQVAWLEEQIDGINARLTPLSSFVLPGGSETAARLHLARTLVRRAERAIVALDAEENLNPVLKNYLNRLSDLLFVMARDTNDGGRGDILWQPGKNR